MNFKSYLTSEYPSRAIIALHGWTGDISSMEPFTKVLKLKDTKWIVPEAPYLATGNGFSWFEGNDSIGWKYDESFRILTTIINNLKDDGFNKNNIFIIGFSQGACLSMEYLIRQKFSLGGIIPIAGFIKYKKRVKAESTQSSKKNPILLLHGKSDKIVDPKESNQSYKILKELGYVPKLELFAGGHKIPIQAQAIIQDFIY